MTTDFLVVGGGMAGVSAAAHLAPHGTVTLIEREPTLAYHTTGRSAALFLINYGTQGTRPLALASEDFLEEPPEDSVDSPILTKRGLLWAGQESQLELLEEMAEKGRASKANSELVSRGEALELVPALKENWLAGGLFEPTARDIDVAGLHQAFVRIARRHGAEIITNAGLRAARREGDGWLVETASGQYVAGAIVNASGAWGDQVATACGVTPIGLQPLRRTAFMVPGSLAYHHWPMVVEADQRFYFKPDGVQLLCSLAEEEPSEPSDPKPRMEDVALAIDRINEATTLGIRTVTSQWTGLRTFSPDRDLVIGEDPTASGFHWLVGQGGIGIQTSPAYGQLLTCLALGLDLPETFVDAGVDPAVTHPARFRH